MVLLPKTVFIGKHKLHGATASAIAAFNEGAVHLSQVLGKLAIESNEIVNSFIKHTDNKRLSKANLASSSTQQKERSTRIKKRQERARQEETEGVSYAPGAF